ncbi:efflux transporter outer membrane subunit [Undibacterium sp.]|jgi:NodT family efflux transporter outer membrane factor (OMF) lipoprotein|uniref:efflux transporter outer membrane subunit n=1 Tax=Undibacterium sp. TaxID=1914977 RepID=UPI002C6CA0C7|nr:efflux transporter outer membrane subunit [Undibacterium sp.]HTD04967.1 efflux transporter outer membrane subunit [Undibacterium sp.]
MHKTKTIPSLSGLPRATNAVLLAAVALMLSACVVGPDYQRPAAAVPAAYKENQDWVPAAPADALDRGAWWTLFNDPTLNELEAAVEVSNQNIAAAVAAYEQARAIVREQRATLFPVVSLDGGGTRSGSGGGSANAASGSTASRAGNNYQLSIGGSWEPDVWGNLGRAVNNASAASQASAADLASAKLSAQGELAINYFSLRLADAQKALLADTIVAYRRSMDITQNRYNAGVATKSDVLQAQTQLANTQADEIGLTRQRAQLEHAIAVLVGKAPGDFTLAPAEWKVTIPDVPVGIPSVLLQRRPDIAAAERRVAAANEQIGIAQSAFFPSLKLNASYGYGASRVADLFSTSANVWSLGLSAAQTLFDAGATRARVDAAKAAYQQTVANYRQTVLTAFQGVEDQLAATRVLAKQQELRRQASAAADQVEQQAVNRYRQGQISYTDVVIAQATALNARSALVQSQADRQTTSISLIQALGGGWHFE